MVPPLPTLPAVTEIDPITAGLQRHLLLEIIQHGGVRVGWQRLGPTLNRPTPAQREGKLITFCQQHHLRREFDADSDYEILVLTGREQPIARRGLPASLLEWPNALLRHLQEYPRHTAYRPVWAWLHPEVLHHLDHAGHRLFGPTFSNALECGWYPGEVQIAGILCQPAPRLPGREVWIGITPLPNLAREVPVPLDWATFLP